MAGEVDLEIDVCGQCCPMPLVGLAKSIGDLKSGQTIEITGNDPIFETTVRDFCRANGHTIIGVTALGSDSVCIQIRVGH
jgi:TusA-related sulfurtransferase